MIQVNDSIWHRLGDKDLETEVFSRFVDAFDILHPVRSSFRDPTNLKPTHHWFLTLGNSTGKPIDYRLEVQCVECEDGGIEVVTRKWDEVDAEGDATSLMEVNFIDLQGCDIC